MGWWVARDGRGLDMVVGGSEDVVRHAGEALAGSSMYETRGECGWCR